MKEKKMWCIKKTRKKHPWKRGQKHKNMGPGFWQLSQINFCTQ